MKKSIPKIQEREGNEKKHSQNSGTGREGNEKIIKRESEAFILGNGREREFPLTPALRTRMEKLLDLCPPNTSMLRPIQF